MKSTGKIAVVLPDLRSGGAERMRVQMAREWIAQGYEVDFVLMQVQGELLALVPEGATVVDLRAKRFRNALWPLARYLRERSPDVLLAAMWPLTTLSLVAAKLAGYKGHVVVSDHIAFSRSPQTATLMRKTAFRRSVGLTYPWAFARIGVSKGVCDDLAELSGLRRSTFDVIYNPAAVEAASGAHSERPSCMSNASVKQVLAVGTLKPQKDFGLLLRAFDKLRLQVPSHLTILGEGGERPALEAMIKQLGLEGIVSLPGSVVDTSPFYASADLFVLSSSFEGFGNVIVEALSHGVSVVSTDCHSGPREILCDGQYGVLVPVGNADALAEGMAEALERPMNPDALRERSADFLPGKIADEYLRAMGLLQ